MKLEDLPGELWFLILSYLSPVEVFYAFSDVNNKRIRSIFTEMYSIRKKNGSSLLKISLVDIPLFLYQFAILHVISLCYNEIHSLTLSNEQTPDQIKDFLQKYSFKDFKYLKFLCLIKTSSNEFNIIINDLCNVETLDIQSEDINSFDINTVQKIFYSESSIILCYLSEFQEEFILNNSHSSMKELVINSCDYLCFVNVLNHFCSLEKLTINTLLMSSNVILGSNSFKENSILLIKDLKICAHSIPFDYLQRLFRYFENIQIFSLSIVSDEENVSPTLFGKYIKKTINLKYTKHLTLHDEFHNMATLHKLIPGLLNITKLTITSNHCILIKQLFQPGCEHLLSLLSARLLHFNLLYSGADDVISCETVQDICYKFRYLKSFSAFLAHFEDFSKSIPLFIYHMKSLQYFHIGLKDGNNEKKICPQDMYECFQRHNISYEFKLHIDTCTNSIHIWL
ncbi:unnamed protein product [Rotaria sp. Silwood1]|nr:unnamed protein product [Rotaria sp. Silwood1]